MAMVFINETIGLVRENHRFSRRKA